MQEFLMNLAPMTALAEIDVGDYVTSQEFFAVLANLFASIFSTFASVFYNGLFSQ